MIQNKPMPVPYCTAQEECRDEQSTGDQRSYTAGRASSSRSGTGSDGSDKAKESSAAMVLEEVATIIALEPGRKQFFNKVSCQLTRATRDKLKKVRKKLQCFISDYPEYFEISGETNRQVISLLVEPATLGVHASCDGERDVGTLAAELAACVRRHEKPVLLRTLGSGMTAAGRATLVRGNTTLKKFINQCEMLRIVRDESGQECMDLANSPTSSKQPTASSHSNHVSSGPERLDAAVFDYAVLDKIASLRAGLRSQQGPFILDRQQRNPEYTSCERGPEYRQAREYSEWGYDSGHLYAGDKKYYQRHMQARDYEPEHREYGNGRISQSAQHPAMGHKNTSVYSAPSRQTDRNRWDDWHDQSSGGSSATAGPSYYARESAENQWYAPKETQHTHPGFARAYPPEIVDYQMDGGQPTLDPWDAVIEEVDRFNLSTPGPARPERYPAEEEAFRIIAQSYQRRDQGKGTGTYLKGPGPTEQLMNGKGGIHSQHGPPFRPTFSLNTSSNTTRTRKASSR